jgi:hypothetical protein
VVVDAGPKNTTDKVILRSERRSALRKDLTGPTLLEMSQNRGSLHEFVSGRGVSGQGELFSETIELAYWHTNPFTKD